MAARPYSRFQRSGEGGEEGVTRGVWSTGMVTGRSWNNR